MTDLQTINGRKSWGPRRFLLGEVIDRLQTVQREFESLLAARAEDERIRSEANVDLNQTLRAMRAVVAEVQQSSASIGEQVGSALAAGLRQEFTATLAQALMESDARFNARMEAFSTQVASVLAEQAVVQNEVSAVAASVASLRTELQATLAAQLTAVLEPFQGIASQVDAQSASIAASAAQRALEHETVHGNVLALTGAVSTIADAQAEKLGELDTRVESLQRDLISLGAEISAGFSALADGQSAMASQTGLVAEQGAALVLAQTSQADAVMAELQAIDAAVANRHERLEARILTHAQSQENGRIANEAAILSLSSALEATRAELVAEVQRVLEQLASRAESDRLAPLLAAVEALRARITTLSGGIAAISLDPLAAEVATLAGTLSSQIAGLKTVVATRSGAEEVERWREAMSPVREELQNLAPALKEEMGRLDRTLREEIKALREREEIDALAQGLAQIGQGLAELRTTVATNAPTPVDLRKVDEVATSLGEVEQKLDAALAAIKANAPVVFDTTKVDATWNTVSDIQNRLGEMLAAVRSNAPIPVDLHKVDEVAVSVGAVQQKMDEALAAIKANAPVIFDTTKVDATWNTVSDIQNRLGEMLAAVRSNTPIPVDLHKVDEVAVSVGAVQQKMDEALAAIKANAPVVFDTTKVDATWDTVQRLEKALDAMRIDAANFADASSVEAVGTAVAALRVQLDFAVDAIKANAPMAFDTTKIDGTWDVVQRLEAALGSIKSDLTAPFDFSKVDALGVAVADVRHRLEEAVSAIKANAPVPFDVTKIDATWNAVSDMQPRIAEAMSTLRAAAPQPTYPGIGVPAELSEALEGLRILQATLVARLQEFKATLESNPLKQQASEIVEEFRKTAGDTNTVINKRMAEVERALITGVSSIGGNLEDLRTEVAQRDRIILDHIEQAEPVSGKPTGRGSRPRLK